MADPIETIRSLIDRIEATPHDGQGVGSEAHAHLTRLLAGINTGDRLSTTHCIASLHDFWLQRVPWCMPLSKDIEKLLILLEEENEPG